MAHGDNMAIDKKQPKSKKNKKDSPPEMGTQLSGKEFQRRMKIKRSQEALNQARQRFYIFDNLCDNEACRHSKNELDAFAAAKDVWRMKVQEAEAEYDKLISEAMKRSKKKAKKQ